MAFAGVLVTCGYVGGSIGKSINVQLMGEMIFSERPAAGTPTVGVVPEVGSVKGSPIFEITTDSDIMVAISGNPDPVNGPRILVRAGETRQLICKQGDRLAWTASL